MLDNLKTKNCKFFLSFIFIFLISFSFVSADKIFSNFDSGLTLQIPSKPYVEQFEDYTLNVHVFNTSNGYQFTNDTISCYSHIYDTSGTHILSKQLTYDASDMEWFVNIDGNNFSKIGYISFITFCNSTNTVGGYLEESAQVTPNGFIGTNNFFWLILAICILLISLGLWTEDIWVSMFGAIATIFFGFYIIINGIDFLKDTTTTYAVGLIVLFVGIYILLRASMEGLYQK